MQLKISTTTYLTLCALVRDALQVDSDAAPLLRRAAAELAAAMANQIPDDLIDSPEKLEALQRAGFMDRAA